MRIYWEARNEQQGTNYCDTYHVDGDVTTALEAALNGIKSQYGWQDYSDDIDTDSRSFTVITDAGTFFKYIAVPE